MATGVDFSFSRVPADVVRAAGHRFGISYLTDQDSSIGHAVKQWRPEEVAAYRAAGLGVVAVWQGGERDRTTAWRGGADRGRRDALRAVDEAAALGRPAGRPIYFAIDADAAWEAVAAYVEGVRSVLGRGKVGVYGGRRVIEGAMASGRVAWFWQTRAWSGGVVVPGIHLYQRVLATKLGGYDVDIDEAHRADYGAWFTTETTGGPGMRLVTRGEWGARPYKRPGGATRYAGPRAGVKIHYLGTPYSSRPHDGCAAYVRTLQASHMDGNGWSDIGYSFVVCEHGHVYEGRGLERRNSANGNTSLNERHYAVCALLGSSGLTQPPDAQLHGLRDAIEYCRSEGPAGGEILGHKDGYATSCPGGPLTAWVRAGAPRPGSAPPGAGRTYTVVAGDTLIRIGAALGVPWADIAQANGLTEPYTIHPGDVLRVPGPRVSLSRVVAAATSDPPAPGTPVSYDGVRVVEDALVAEGLLAPSLADGHFGSATVEAYAALQRRYGYRGGDADGIPGEESLSRLGNAHGFTVTA